MTDYDNTNKGAAFKPFPEQSLILQGKLNMEGIESNIALIVAQSKSGDKRIDVYQKVGALFDNDKNGNDKAPDYSGPMEGGLSHLRIAGWKGIKDGIPYMTFQVSEKMNKPVDNTVANDVDDVIPF